MSNIDKSNRNMDQLLKDALRPEFAPSAELNEGILCGKAVTDPERQRQGIRKWYMLPKAAVAAAAIVLIGSAGVYAATQLLKEPVVTEHTVSVGNTEYVNDDAIMATEQPAKVEIISSEEGNASTKWLARKVETVNGYTNTWLTYASYAEAVEEAGMESWLSGNYELTSPAIYRETEGQGYHSREVSAEFMVKGGLVNLSQSQDVEGVAEDAAYSIQMNHPANERSYTAVSGLQFKLVDDMAGEGQEITTYVLIATDRYNGYLAFSKLSDNEIHEILDKVTIQ
jgi:hypothetical protein